MRTLSEIGIHGNPALSDLSALSSLEELGALSVSGNSALTALGLPPLSTVEVVRVSGNPLLDSLGPNVLGRGSLSQLYLRGPLLVDLSALSSVDSVSDQMILEDLDSLDSLTPLDGIGSVGHLLRILKNDMLPQADAEAWAALRGASTTKVDGNLGAAPHLDECPWTDDLECDEEEGTGLCPPGSDVLDCTPSED